MRFLWVRVSGKRIGSGCNKRGETRAAVEGTKCAGRGPHECRIDPRQREKLPRVQDGARGTTGTIKGTPARAHPYEHPYYWAGFILIGDPN